ncbi:MAG TPA: hypothetical protein VLE22_12645 [Bryobacteraceae bacterium]|nr:hypothetical protein [Bryobacteraceae bacterium]
MSNVYGPRLVTPPVSGHPFCASTEAASEKKTWLGLRRKIFTGVIARDGQGRLRTEFGVRGQPLVIGIVDPVSLKAYALDPRRETFFELPECPPQPVLPALQKPPGAETQRIEGLECFRRVIPELIEEAWISSELQHVVLERAVDGGVRFTWRMYDIRLGEPDPALFRIPPTYKQA